MFIKLWYIIIFTIVNNYIDGKILGIFWKIITWNFPQKYDIFWENYSASHHNLMVTLRVWLMVTLNGKIDGMIK